MPSATVLPASRVPPRPEVHQIGARKRRAPGNIILNQPCRRRVSADHLSREDSQLAASLESGPGLIHAGKALPHSDPETRFRRGVNECYESLERVLGINHKYWNHGKIKGDKSVFTPFDIRNGVILTLEG